MRPCRVTSWGTVLANPAVRRVQPDELLDGLRQEFRRGAQPRLQRLVGRQVRADRSQEDGGCDHADDQALPEGSDQMLLGEWFAGVTFGQE